MTPFVPPDPDDPLVPYNDLARDGLLRARSPGRDAAIRALPWIEDGMVFSEQRAAQRLIDLALSDGQFFDTFVGHTFVQEGQWFPAIESLGLLARNHIRHFATVRDHPRIMDGISEEEAPIVAVLYDVAMHNPGLLPRMLDFDSILVEERDIDLPLSREARISIVRTEPGLATTMDLLEAGVAFVEEWMGAPLLRRNLVFFFGDAAAAGQGHNSWLAIVSPPALVLQRRLQGGVSGLMWRRAARRLA